jgi:transposase
MINVPAGARVLLATRPIDFRKGAHSLAALAQEVLAEDPFICVGWDYVAAPPRSA